MIQWKIFPATITNDGSKVPLISGWKFHEKATNDLEQLSLWKNLFRNDLKIWGIPTGAGNDLLVLDVDVKGNGSETLKSLNLEIPRTLTQRTISGGYHYLFRYPKDGKHYGNKVKFLPGLDVRGEGGWIAYYGNIEDFSTSIADAPQWLLDAIAIKTSPQPQGETIRMAPEIAQGVVERALEAIRNAPEGESNNTLNVQAYLLGQLVASQSITRDYAEQALYRAAKDRGKPDYEARATIKSGLDGGLKHPITSPFSSSPPVAGVSIPPIPTTPEPPPRWTPRLLTKYDLMNTTKLRKPQLFQDWSTEDIHITTADGGTGKTTLKLFESICLALGERFLGFDCKQAGKTLFITGEDTEEKLAAMLGAIMRQMGLFKEEPGNQEKIETILQSIVFKKDADLCLIQKDRQGFLVPNAEAMRKITEAIEDFKPKMIVFDPIASFWGSEAALNDMNKAVTKFMGQLVEHDVCVEMINHMGKSSSANKDMSQFAGRGGSGLPSNSRVSRVLRQLSHEEYLEMTGEALDENKSSILCNVNKFTDGSPLYNKPFVIIRDGYLFERKVLPVGKARELEKQLSDVEKVFAFVKEQRSMGRYPTKSVVIGYMLSAGDSISEARVKRALDILCYSGHMGEKLALVDNPDLSIRDKVFIITDSEGREA